MSRGGGAVGAGHEGEERLEWKQEKSCVAGSDSELMTNNTTVNNTH